MENNNVFDTAYSLNEEKIRLKMLQLKFLIN